MKAVESCKKIEDETNSRCSKHMDQQKSNIISDIQQCFKEVDMKITYL